MIGILKRIKNLIKKEKLEAKENDYLEVVRGLYNDYSEPVVDVVRDKEAKGNDYSEPVVDVVKDKAVKGNKEKKEDLPGINNSEDSVLNYLKEILKSLYIEITDSDAENILDLIPKGALMGWCWETTQTCAIFFKNSDYVERGDLYINERNPKYHHSWIVFTFNDKEYIFDPCLDCLCSKKLYYTKFNVQLKGKSSVEKIKKHIIQTIKNKPKQVELKDDWAIWWWNKLSLEEQERKLQEVTIDGTEDVNAEIYRGSVGYRAKFKNDDLEEVTAHYYFSGMI